MITIFNLAQEYIIGVWIVPPERGVIGTCGADMRPAQQGAEGSRLAVAKAERSIRLIGMRTKALF